LRHGSNARGEKNDLMERVGTDERCAAIFLCKEDMRREIERTAPRLLTRNDLTYPEERSRLTRVLTAIVPSLRSSVPDPIRTPASFL
jgi:hypothetical protein